MVQIKCCRKPLDIKLSDLWVSSHSNISDFYTSSCQPGDSPIPLLLLRLLALLVSIAIMSWTMYEGCNFYWLVFLTNWGLLLVTAMFLSGAVVSIAAITRKIPEVGEMPWYFSMYWFLHNVAVGVSLLITALYWTLLYDPAIVDIVGTRLFVMDLMTHGVNSVLVMLELLVSRTPVYLLHIYQPLGVGLWYGAFTGIYYLSGGTNGNGEPFIYEILDWRHYKRCACIIGISAAGLIIIYCFVYGVAFCRDKFSNSFFRTATIKLTHNMPPDDLATRTFPGPMEFV